MVISQIITRILINSWLIKYGSIQRYFPEYSVPIRNVSHYIKLNVLQMLFHVIFKVKRSWSLSGHSSFSDTNWSSMDRADATSYLSSTAGLRLFYHDTATQTLNTGRAQGLQDFRYLFCLVKLVFQFWLHERSENVKENW